jgi:hypothetical protein
MKSTAKQLKTQTVKGSPVLLTFAAKRILFKN